MKKIILWLIIFLWIGGVTYGIDECVTDSQCWEWERCTRWTCIIYIESTDTDSTDECIPENCDWICQDNVCIKNDYWDLWIHVNTDCLLNGQCSMNIYETIWIRKKNPNPDVKFFAQDIILWASLFFGTVMTVIFIVSGLSFVFAWYTGKSPEKAKNMMKWSIIGLLFVTLSYTIIRLIQFLATWWS